MCIIVCKPEGITITKKTLETCFANNPHGAGFAYFDESGKVQVKKGFMTFKPFWKNYRNQVSMDKLTVFHFRISTSGGISPEKTHPFPIYPDYTSMELLNYSYDSVVFHNGIFKGLGTKEVSDTMEFIQKYLVPLKARIMAEEEGIINLLELAIDSSKLCFLNSNTQKALLLGSWKESGGIFYSNSSYLPAIPKSPYKSPYLWDFEKKYTSENSSYSGVSGINVKNTPSPVYGDELEINEYCPLCSSLMEDTTTGFYCETCNLWFTFKELRELRESITIEGKV